jgi:glucokinase
MTNCLVADIGGTQARFALLSGSQLGPVYTIQVGKYHDAVQAIRHFLNCKANAWFIDSAIIAAAGPVSGGRCKLTNADWTTSDGPRTGMQGATPRQRGRQGQATCG